MSDIELDSPEANRSFSIQGRQNVSVDERGSAEDELSQDDGVEKTGIEPWDILKMSLQRLETNPCIPSSLQAVVAGLLECLPYFKATSDDNQLPLDFATLIVSIDAYSWTPESGGTMTLSGFAEHCISEIRRVTNRVIGASRSTTPDSSDIVEYCTCINELLNKLEIEVELGACRIDDDFSTDDYLQELFPAHNAIYNASLLYGWRRGCAPNTRMEDLESIRDWIRDSDAPGTYWLIGPPEVGKTTIAYTICEKLDRDNQLAASFFGSELLPDCRDIRRVIPTIAYQLAQFSYSFELCLRRILRENPGLKEYDLETQFEELLRNPLLGIAKSLPSRLVIVLDALEECVGFEDMDERLHEFICQPNLPIKFLVVSECGPAAGSPFTWRGVPRFHHLSQSAPQVQRDIATFFKQESGKITGSLTGIDISLLIRLAGGSFLYATICARYMLSMLWISSTDAKRPTKPPFSLLKTLTEKAGESRNTLAVLYTTILTSALKGPQAQYVVPMLQAISYLDTPVSINALMKLLGLDNKSDSALLLQSLPVIHLSNDGDTIFVFHPSFRIFLLYTHQLYEGLFSGFDIGQQNTAIAVRCLSIMKRTLRFNIYQQEISHSLDIVRPNNSHQARYHIPPEFLYACRCWGEYVGRASSSESLLSGIREFLLHNLLHWMEVLNQNDWIGDGMLVLSQAEEWLSSFGAQPEDLQFVRDAHAFIASFNQRSTLLSTPSIYVTALPTWGATSPVSKCYRGKIRNILHSTGVSAVGVSPALLSMWPTGSIVRSISISLDGTQVLSNSTSCGVRAWDLDNGDNIGIVDQLHLDFWDRLSLTSVAFSLDGSQIVIGSDDHSVTVWSVRDKSTSKIRLSEHDGAVNSVAVSPDGTLVASGSDDCTLRLWNLKSSTLSQITPSFRHGMPVLSVAFSPDGRLVASGSDDCKICVTHTNPSIGTRLKRLEGHTGSVNSVAFAPNSQLMVSGSSDHTIRLWSMETWPVNLFKPHSPPIKGHTDSVNSVMFSPNGTYIVSGSSDLTICTWDVQSGKLVLGPFRGHTKRINAVLFTHDGTRILSGSDDGTICVWSAERGAHLQIETPEMNQASPTGAPGQINSLQSRGMSAPQMFERLVAHGCLDLISTVDSERFSSGIINGGSFGDIWKGRLKNGTDVAIKAWRFTSITEDASGGKSLKRAMRELYNWSKMNHKNIHKLLGVIMFQGRLGMVSRWMDNGHLREYIEKNKAADRYQLCIQVAEGIKYLHGKNMVHGDLKACNILVSSDGIPKITDFDHSIISDCSLLFSATTQMGGGTLRWMAPELVLETTHQRSKRADVYALGMTFLVRLPNFSDAKLADDKQEIITETIPYFPECRIDAQIFLKLSQKALPTKTKDFTQDERGERMWALLVKCWDHNPAARPTAHEVLDELQRLVDETTPSTATV